jgi:hypothetical protein
VFFLALQASPYTLKGGAEDCGTGIDEVSGERRGSQEETGWDFARIAV